MDECLDRFFANKDPLRKKWFAFGVISGRKYDVQHPILHLYHYTHLVLRYNLETHEILEEWWEKPADKRGLDAAKAYLKDKFKT